MLAVVTLWSGSGSSSSQCEQMENGRVGVVAEHRLREPHGVFAGLEARGEQFLRAGPPLVGALRRGRVLRRELRRHVVVGVREAGAAVEPGQTRRRGLDVPDAAGGVGQQVVGAACAGRRRDTVADVFEAPAREQRRQQQVVGHAHAHVPGVQRVGAAAEAV